MEGGDYMKLKFIKTSSVEHVGIGARRGEIVTKIYECPCGKGIVTYEKDDIIGLKNSDVWCDCEECSEKYEFQRDGIAKKTTE